jgi:uncharacterized membrane protein
MKVLITTGCILLGIALTGFGVIQLATQNFLISLLPFNNLPLKFFWVNITAIIFILCGILFILRKWVTQASGITALLFTLFFLYPHLPRLISNSKDPRVWTVAFETLAIASCAWLISAIHIKNSGKMQKWISPVQASGTVSRYVFAACLIVFGVQHFMYDEFIITLMPAWMPLKILWSYMIKFGFLLAALSLILNKKVSLSMMLLGIMFFIWVAVLHAPRSFLKMNDANEWTSLCIALAMSGIAFYTSGVTAKGNNKTPVAKVENGFG